MPVTRKLLLGDALCRVTVGRALRLRDSCSCARSWHLRPTIVSPLGMTKMTPVGTWLQCALASVATAGMPVTGEDADVIPIASGLSTPALAKPI